MKVENMDEKSGKVANQFIIRDGGNTFFLSYNSIIVKISGGETYLDADKWDYSTTTGKYRNMFLGETKKDTEKKIKDGTYKLVNLNG